MANSSKKGAQRRKSVKPKPEKIETEPDAWDRFEKTIGNIVPPKRRPPKKGGATKKPGK